MNLSKEVTMIILEKLIKDFENSVDKNIRDEALIKVFQFHLRSFDKCLE
jgi:hypothetical protein